MSLEDILSTIETKEGVLLYFSGEECSVCHALRPKIKKLFKAEFPKVQQIFLDAKVNQDISVHFNVLSVPTILLFLDGKEYIREGRMVSLSELSQKLSKPYSMLMS